MLEYIQQAGFTYEMPAPYKLACTHRRETHWRHQAGIDSLSLVRGRRVFLLVLPMGNAEEACLARSHHWGFFVGISGQNIL